MLSKMDFKLLIVLALFLAVFALNGDACPPGLNFQRKRIRKPFEFKQYEPNFVETDSKASGSYKRVKRGTEEYDELIINVNPNIVFKDDRGTGDNRRMTKVCNKKYLLFRFPSHGELTCIVFTGIFTSVTMIGLVRFHSSGIIVIVITIIKFSCVAA